MDGSSVKKTMPLCLKLLHVTLALFNAVFSSISYRLVPTAFMSLDCAQHFGSKA